MAGPTLEDLLSVSESLETGAARAYAAFSYLFGEGNARLRRFWWEMSVEEWEHASLVAMARVLLSRKGGLERPAPFSPESAAAAPRRAIERVNASLREGSLTLREAFEAAVEIERSETNRIFAEVCRLLAKEARDADLPALAAAAEAAGAEGSDHVEHLLEEMKRTLGDPDLVREARRNLSGNLS
ncbi:MAG: hypothetical protein KatS3mg014_2686 [Actinomycetota bacterium]|nr:MAG: hypothetical protein KatS3mg014_2686 [Actinomycetota bacterium]